VPALRLIEPFSGKDYAVSTEVVLQMQQISINLLTLLSIQGSVK
jgi:hypothetical protein